MTAESASDLAAEPPTDDEIRWSPCALRARLAVAVAALARQDLRHLAVWAAVVSLLSLNYSVDFSGLQMNVSLIRPFRLQLVSTRGHLL